MDKRVTLIVSHGNGQSALIINNTLIVHSNSKEEELKEEIIELERRLLELKSKVE